MVLQVITLIDHYYLFSYKAQITILLMISSQGNIQLLLELNLLQILEQEQSNHRYVFSFLQRMHFHLWRVVVIPVITVDVGCISLVDLHLIRLAGHLDHLVRLDRLVRP